MLPSAKQALLVQQKTSADCASVTYEVEVGERAPGLDGPPLQACTKEPARFWRVLLQALAAWPC